jgi:hypothetical protein
LVNVVVVVVITHRVVTVPPVINVGRKWKV